MPIYKNIKDIPYPFLHDACLLIDSYTEGVSSVVVTDKGECHITIKGMMDDRKAFQRIMRDLDYFATAKSKLSDYKPKIFENYDWSCLLDETYIYTNRNVDYREL